MRNTIALFVLLAITGSLHAAGKPNIIFFLADDAGVGDFACYGGKHIATPNIDKLAAQGMTFTNAYSGSAVCAPTRCVLMTGLHTGHCRRRANQSRGGLIFLTPQDRTVAQLLKEHGYATGGFGKWGLGNPGSDGVPEKKGFDLWYGYYDQVHAHDYFTRHLVRNSQDVPLPGNQGRTGTQYSADLIAQETLQFIELNKDKPFFIYAAWTLPHGDYVIPDNRPYDRKTWPLPVKNYAAMVAKFDHDLGMVMDKLKQLGIDDNTLVFFSSDNGANTEFIKNIESSAGLRGSKRLLYEGGVRAPLIARWPGRIKGGSTSDLLTSHVDFFATIADILGARPPANLDGVSILPALRGENQSRDHLYFEIYESNLYQQALRQGDWKTYRNLAGAPLELYNLRTDPFEKNNVAAQHPDITARMDKIMACEHVPSPHWPEVIEKGKGKAKKSKKK